MHKTMMNKALVHYMRNRHNNVQKIINVGQQFARMMQAGTINDPQSTQHSWGQESDRPDVFELKGVYLGTQHEHCVLCFECSRPGTKEYHLYVPGSPDDLREDLFDAPLTRELGVGLQDLINDNVNNQFIVVNSNFLQANAIELPAYIRWMTGIDMLSVYNK